MPRRRPPGGRPPDLRAIASRGCPFPVCNELITEDRLACPPHWASLPGKLRQQWMTARQGSPEDKTAVREAVKEYATTQTPTEGTTRP